jgi:enterochelin esterase-like enzyme
MEDKSLPLTSLRLLALCVGLAVAIPTALVVLYRRAPRRPRWAVTILIGVLLAQTAAISAVVVSVNRDYGFYPTWSSLWGTPAAPPVAPLVTAGGRLGLNAVIGKPRPVLATARPVPMPGSKASADVGRFQSTVLKGARSGVSQTVMTWFPPQYHERQFAKTRFPVVMVLGGADAHIQPVVKRLNFARTAAEEIRSGRVAPFVAVFPEMNVALPVETECTDYPGGPQAFAWLNQDVRNWAISTLRVTSDGRRWSVMGWSTGGYCAAMLHLREPDRFGAAASVEGYFSPWPDGSTGNLRQLLKTYPTLAHESSPTWLIEHRPPPRVHLLVMSSNKDPYSYPQAVRFLQREQNVPGVQPFIVQSMKHSLDTYRQTLAPILNWMAAVADL